METIDAALGYSIAKLMAFCLTAILAANDEGDTLWGIRAVWSCNSPLGGPENFVSKQNDADLIVHLVVGLLYTCDQHPLLEQFCAD